MSGKVTAGARLTKLGRYEVLNELGKGAMGVVYLAKDPVIGRLVAVKTIRTSQTGDDDSESREFRERFVREAQTAGILSHPNIVTIHDIGEDSESRTSFIAMEYIEGRNLKSLLQDKNKFTWDEIADLIAQIGEALDYAHRKGIIHRDIKPANIIMTTDGKIKITDFGIAKVASSNLTTTGQFLGTPNYMSPEQVSGAPVDGRSDIFSLGVVLYELLTNRKPFQGDNLTAISYKIVHEDFTPPGDLSSEVPHEFNPIVARAMAKDPWNRYQRGKDMALALYQLKAHLEEEKALQDLGTMVSAAESLPTMKLGNLMELAAQAAPKDAAVTAPPPSQVQPPPPAPAPLPKTTATTEVPTDRADSSGDHEVTTAAPALATAMMSIPELPERARGPEAKTPPPPTSPLATPAPPAPPIAPLPNIATPPAPQDWKTPAGVDVKKLARAEVNPRWFWMVVAAAAGALILVVAFFALRARSVATPQVQVDTAREQLVKDRHQAIEDTKKLVAAGQYEEALAKARQVLAVSPNNEEARKYAQMAESGLASRQAENEHKQQAATTLAAAKVALADGKYDEAKQKADQTLALDPANTEAASVRDEADGKLAAARATDEAARKKDAKAKELQAAKKKDVAPAPSPSRVAAPVAQGPSPVPAVVSGTATLRIVFDAPAGSAGALPENIMVAVNGQRVLTEPLPFKKAEARSASFNISVPSGAAAVKVWLSGIKMESTAFGETNVQLSGGETRTVRLDYSGGRQLALRAQ